MIREYDIDLYDGHLIIKENGKTLLLDTGSPISLTDCDSFEFFCRPFTGQSDIGGKGVLDVSRQIGRNIDALIGMDILSQYVLVIDYQNRLLKVVDDHEHKPEGLAVDLGNIFMGGFCVKMTVGGQVYNFALDTGAKISYIKKEVVSESTAIEYRQDFNPLLGYFSTPIFPMEVGICNTHFRCDFGNLPAIAEMTLKMMGVDGVIGFDLFKSFMVTLDFVRANMYLVSNINI